MILITGGTGFVGRLLIRELLAEGYEVRCLFRRKEINGVENWKGDLRDHESLVGIGRDVEVVIHLAAVGEVNAVSKKHLRRYFETNVRGLKNLLEECEDVKKFIMLSSLVVEKDYYSAYGETKRLAEKMLISSGLPYLIIRVPMIYDWDEPKGDFKRIVEMVKKGCVFFIDRGKYRVDLVSREKVVRKLMREINSREKDKVEKLVGKSLSFDELIEKIAKKYELRMPKHIKLPFVPLSPLFFSVDLLARFFGFVPPISFGRARYLHEQDKNAPAGI